VDTIPDPGEVTPAAKTVELTREELYELVWTVPMQRLAERYGISDVALAKTCRNLVIPVPPRGYWRRKETGRVPARPPLRSFLVKIPATCTNYSCILWRHRVRRISIFL